MANEPLRALQWIIATLNADSTFVAACPGGIWRGLAPQNPATATPYCVLSIQSAPDYLTFNGVRIWSDCSILVKIVGPASADAALQTAADRVDVLLNRKTGSAGGSQMLSCVRISSPSTDELVNGVLWSNFSGIYRIFAA